MFSGTFPSFWPSSLISALWRAIFWLAKPRGPTFTSNSWANRPRANNPDFNPNSFIKSTIEESQCNSDRFSRARAPRTTCSSASVRWLPAVQFQLNCWPTEWFAVVYSPFFLSLIANGDCCSLMHTTDLVSVLKDLVSGACRSSRSISNLVFSLHRCSSSCWFPKTATLAARSVSPSKTAVCWLPKAPLFKSSFLDTAVNSLWTDLWSACCCLINDSSDASLSAGH